MERKTLLLFFTWCLVLLYIISGSSNLFALDVREFPCYQKLASVDYHLDRTPSEKRSRRGDLAIDLSVGTVFGIATIVGSGWAYERFLDYRSKSKVKKLAKRNISVTMELIRMSASKQSTKRSRNLKRYQKYLYSNFACKLSTKKLASLVVQKTISGALCHHLSDRQSFPYYSTNFNLYSQLVPDYVALFYRDYRTYGSSDHFSDPKYSDLRITDILLAECRLSQIRPK